MVTGNSSLVWSLDSDNTWIAETVGLGNEGTQVITEHGFYANEVALLSSHVEGAAASIWSDQENEYNFVRHVASSRSSDVHISVHQEYVDSSFTQRRSVLRRYSSASSTPLWTYESGALITNHTHSWGTVSANGQVIVLLVYDEHHGSTRATFFSADSPVPVHEELISTLAGFEEAELSDDGSTMVISARHKQTIYDLTTFSVAHSVYTLGQPQHGGVGISADGSTVTFGTPGALSVFERDEFGAYQQAFVFDLPPGAFLRSPTLSADGLTLVAGVQSFGNSSDARFVVVDLPTQSIQLDVQLQGGGHLQNFIQDIQCSSDGSRFAIGMWGDENDLVPELVVYSLDVPNPSQPVLAEHLPGSVNSLEFSADGEWLAVASKGVHANVWGTGGAVSLYRIGLVDVSISGVPIAGSSVTLKHQLRAGTNSRVLVSSGLLDTPDENSTYGAGTLYLDPQSIVELPATISTEFHVAETAFEIPAGTPVGTTYYMQAIDLDSAELSRDWVKLTVVP